jgi:hypothetical protein
MVPRDEDKLALDVYQYARATGEPLTLATVERRLQELRAHKPGCACGLCEAADSVRASGVWYVVRGWLGGITAMRRRSAG